MLFANNTTFVKAIFRFKTFFFPSHIFKGGPLAKQKSVTLIESN